MKRVVIFDTNRTISHHDAYGFLIKEIAINAGENTLETNTACRDYYKDGDVCFLVLPGEGSINLNECLSSPDPKNIKHFFWAINDAKNEYVVDVDFEQELDRFMLKSKEPFFDAEQRKGFECFLLTMNAYTKRDKKVFDIKECFALNKFYAAKVRKHKEDRICKI